MNKPTKSIVILALIFGTLIVLVGIGGAVFYVVSARGGVDVAGSLVNKPYKPTSVWIEEGVDPDVTQFGFGGKEAPKPTGAALSDADVYDLVQNKQQALMPCYVEALEEDDELQGKVDMQFGIAPDGHLSLVKVTRSSLRSKTTEDCFVEKARDWKFPSTGRATLMKFDTDFTFVYE